MVVVVVLVSCGPLEEEDIEQVSEQQLLLFLSAADIEEEVLLQVVAAESDVNAVAGLIALSMLLLRLRVVNRRRIFIQKSCAFQQGKMQGKRTRF